MISTIHRRNILSLFEKKRTVSLTKLKQEFIESGYMNQTTLYRILEKFLSESIVHKAEFNNEKFFTLCECQSKNTEAVKLKCCISCYTIKDNHTPLSPESVRSETIELVKHCEKCQK